MSLFALARAVALRCLPRPLVNRLQQTGFYLRRHYGARLASFDAKDEPDLQVVQALVRPGDLALDIGANIGVYTLFLSRALGPAGRVWSLEPVPLTYSALRYNVRVLHLENVRPLPYAATARDGPVLMDLPEGPSGQLDIYLARINTGGASSRCVEVSGRSIDSLCAELDGRPFFIKIDVEGHEAACLDGSERVLHDCRPALLIEMTSDLDDPRSDSAAIVARTVALGYRCFWWDGEELRARRPGDTHVNYFFLQEDHLARVVAAGIPLAG
jgi:FkbM family methyltransferase